MIDETYFFNEFEIGNKAIMTPKILEYIANYEPEYIEKALGKDFAALYNGSTDPRFDTLDDMFKAKPSPIAGYVFWHYQRDTAIISAGAGDTKGKVENGTRTPELYRMVTAWNIMAEKTREIRKYLKDNRAIFPEFQFYETCYDLIKKQNVFGI